MSSGPSSVETVEADAAEVVQQRPIRADAAQRRLPGVAMRVHEAGHHDLAAGVEDLGVASLEGGSTAAMRPSSISTSARSKSPERRVEREDAAVADEQALAHSRAVGHACASPPRGSVAARPIAVREARPT